MAQRYFLHLAYNGAPFHGWQVQPNAVSVQSVVENALSMILRQKITVTGAGRTDTGVNARTMYAHFDCNDEIDDEVAVLKRGNSLVGRDIALQSLRKMPMDAHARFDAVSRTYKYFVVLDKSPFDYPFSWYCHSPLDFVAMNEAAAEMMRYSDFTSFSKLHTDVKTNICRITYAKWEQEGGKWVFTITADRFLRNMVRAIVGTLVEVGRHRISIDEFCAIIEKKNRCSAGTSMPGNALFLWDIAYPYTVD